MNIADRAVNSRRAAAPRGGYKDIPSPAGHPRWGLLPDWLGKRKALGILHTLQGYAAECGGLARIDLGVMRYLLVTDPGLIHDALTDEPTNVKGWSYALTRVVLDNVLLLNGEPWKTHRKLYRDALRVADPIGAAQTCVDAWLAGLAARAEGRAGLEVALDAEAMQLMADVCCRMLCGATFPPALHEARETIQHELAAVGIDMQCQPWTYLSPRRWWRLAQSNRAMRAFFSRHVEERRRRRDAGPVADALGGLLARSPDGSDDALRDGLVNLFFTAHDVTTVSLSWCLHLLARHPEWQARIREELEGVDLAAITSRDALAGLDVLSRCVRESLRLYPGYPLFARRTTRPLVLDGYEVPAGVELLIVPRVVHRSADYWDDPERFDPDRWRDLGRTPPGPGPRDNYLPFGGGHRSCIAYWFAFPMMQLLVARCVEAFDLEVVPGHAPREVYWGSIYSENALPARLTPR